MITPFFLGTIAGATASGRVPELLPGLTATKAAGDPAVPLASLGALAVGGAILVPSLLWLLLIFSSDRAGTGPASRVPHW